MLGVTDGDADGDAPIDKVPEAVLVEDAVTDAVKEPVSDAVDDRDAVAVELGDNDEVGVAEIGTGTTARKPVVLGAVASSV